MPRFNELVLALAATTTALAAAPTTARAQTMLDRLLGAMGKQKKGTAPAAGDASAPRGADSALSASTPAQDAALDRLLTVPAQGAGIAADRAAAAPLIRVLVATGACATSGAAWNALNRQRVEPKTYYGNWAEAGVAPMFAMRYHDKRRCLDVTRLSDWTKPARNALSFRAHYVSESSGEAGSLPFTVQKDPDGQWLVRSIG